MIIKRFFIVAAVCTAANLSGMERQAKNSQLNDPPYSLRYCSTPKLIAPIASTDLKETMRILALSETTRQQATELQIS